MHVCDSARVPTRRTEVNEQLWLELTESRKDASALRGSARFREPERLATMLERTLDFLQDKVRERKLRLYAVACWRRVLHLLPPRAAEVLAIAEQIADGAVDVSATKVFRDALATLRPKGFAGPLTPDAGALYQVERLTRQPLLGEQEYEDYFTRQPRSRRVRASELGQGAPGVISGTIKKRVQARLRGWRRFWHNGVTIGCWCSLITALGCRAQYRALAAQASYLRDLFGNPFRPVAFDATWRTPAIVKLARIIYDGGDFARLPELAQALENAGCRDATILQHCRRPGIHIRGCWLLDLLLGYE